MASDEQSHPSATAAAIAHYTSRAETYDASNTGWHITHPVIQVNVLSISPGAKCLDLACGTGLVSLPLARAAGSNGVVIGIDITPAMLQVARARELEADMAPITYIEGDITSPLFLRGVPEVQHVLDDNGGFDVITCCSALVLLPDPAAAIRNWAGLLKGDGGKLLVDVPTEDKTLQSMFAVELPSSMRLKCDFDRSWIKDIHSLEHLCEVAGLKIRRSWQTANLVAQQSGEHSYTQTDGETVFDEQMRKLGNLLGEQMRQRRSEARETFLQLWNRECERQGGRFVDGHWLYVTIAERHATANEAFIREVRYQGQDLRA